MSIMFPTFEKRRSCPNAWKVGRRKVFSAPNEFTTANERSKTFKGRLHQSRSRSLGHHDVSPTNLPVIKEPENLRAGTQAGLDGSFPASRIEKIRFGVRRCKKSSTGSTAALTHFEPVECFRRLVRLVRIVIRVANALKSDTKLRFHEGICKYVLEIMEAYTVTKERNLTENRRDLLGSSSDDLVFDPKFFKANKEVKISKEVKQVLHSRAEERTSDQLQTVLYALQTLESFSELPLHMQQDICKVAWLQSLPSNKIIIQQGHPPENFYFIITGTVTVLSENDPTMDSLFTSLGTLKRGFSFGETAILRNCCRTATVISKDPVQLLMISKKDYQRIFMGHTKDGQEPAHLSFCRSLEFLADWPVNLLLDNPENCLFHYFRRGTVIVKDSNESDWLYIIVSGVCQVLLGLEVTNPNLTGKRREEKSTADKLAALTDNRHRKSIYSKRKAISPAFVRPTCDDKLTNPLPSVSSAVTSGPSPLGFPCILQFPVTEFRSQVPRKPRKQTAFVQLELLHPRSVFGLWTLLNFEQDFQFPHPASVTLVSRSAECVMISKKFFMAQASELTKKWIRHNVRSYPSKETLQRNLQERINWDAYKHDVVKNVVTR